jgi:hypothetical protein
MMVCLVLAESDCYLVEVAANRPLSIISSYFLKSGYIDRLVPRRNLGVIARLASHFDYLDDTNGFTSHKITV